MKWVCWLQSFYAVFWNLRTKSQCNLCKRFIGIWFCISRFTLEFVRFLDNVWHCCDLTVNILYSRPTKYVFVWMNIRFMNNSIILQPAANKEARLPWAVSEEKNSMKRMIAPVYPILARVLVTFSMLSGKDKIEFVLNASKLHFNYC